MSRVNPIDLVLQKLHATFKADPRLERSIQLELEKLVRMTYQDSITQKTGWCMLLKVPHLAVINLFKKLTLDEKTIKRMFLDQFNIPGDPFMWGNSYYHILLLLVLYGVKYGNDSMAKNAEILVLLKLWNGRRSHLIPYCDPDTMRYVVANLSGRSYFKKFDSPMTLLMSHFAPTLLKKYGSQMRLNSDVIKRFFDQSFGRLRQLFIQDRAPDLKSGIVKARAGIATLYFAAKDKGYKLSSSKMRSNLDDDFDVVDFYSSGEFDEIIESITNYIIINIQPKYDKSVIDFIHNQSHVNKNIINLLLTSMHSVKYQKHIQEILELFLRQLQVNDKFDVCIPDFLSNVVKRKVVASKHSPVVMQFKTLIGDLTEKIFDDKINYARYCEYSDPIRGQLRKIIIYGIAYNLQKFICSKVQRR